MGNSYQNPKKAAINVSVLDLLAQTKWNKQIIMFFREHHSYEAWISHEFKHYEIFSTVQAAGTLLLQFKIEVKQRPSSYLN